MCYNIARFVINEVELGNRQGNRNLCLDLSRLGPCCINEQFQLSILSLSVFLCLTWPTHTGFYLNLSPAWSANFWLTTNALGSVSMPVSSRLIWKQWALKKKAHMHITRDKSERKMLELNLGGVVDRSASSPPETLLIWAWRWSESWCGARIGSIWYEVKGVVWVIPPSADQWTW